MFFGELVCGLSLFSGGKMQFEKKTLKGKVFDWSLRAFLDHYGPARHIVAAPAVRRVYTGSWQKGHMSGNLAVMVPACNLRREPMGWRGGRGERS